MAEATDVQRRTSVFIVGGGPVGLAMGLLLDRFGIDAVIVEKSPTTTDHPKSRGCWVRTMEIFRQWGIEQRIRDRGLQENSDIFVQVESIAGHEIGRSRPEPNLGQTPAWKCLVAQDAVEEEIYRVIEHSNRVQVRFSTEFMGFEETSDGIVISEPGGGIVEVNPAMCQLHGYTREERQIAAANVHKAVADIESVQSIVDQMVVYAPIASQVYKRNVEAGEYVSPGVPLFTLIDLDDRWVHFDLREDLARTLKVGERFEVRVPALADRVITVEVRLIATRGEYASWRATRATGDFDLRTFEVRAYPVDNVPELRPGMSAYTDWRSRR